MSENDIQQVSARFYAAANRMLHGDAEPMLALWSQQDDITYLDPRGDIHRGREAMRAHWEHAAQLNRAAPGAIRATTRDLAVQVQGHLAYTVTLEQIRAEHDDRVTEQTAYATNVYRYEVGEWKMIHRHAGMPREAEAHHTDMPRTPAT